MVNQTDPYLSTEKKYRQARESPMPIILCIHLYNEDQWEYPVGVHLHRRLNQVSPRVSPRADDDCHSYSSIYEIVDLHHVGLYHAIVDLNDVHGSYHHHQGELEDLEVDWLGRHTDVRR